MGKSFKVAVCQMQVVDDKQINVEKAVDFIGKSASKRADLVVLPEMFNCPYENEKFPLYAETRKSSETLKAVSGAARDHGVYLVAGSIPERDEDKIYNTSFIIDPHGKIIGSHRKIHLFDVDIPGGITFKESDTLSAGDRLTVLETDLARIGVAICYDIRFPELSRLLALEDVELMVLPGAFNMTTGPAHWKTLIKSRAIDNQFYVVAASPAQDVSTSYIAYGHSMVVGPWGSVLAEAGNFEEIIYADIRLDRIEEVRRELPVLLNRRTDIYDIIKKSK